MIKVSLSLPYYENSIFSKSHRSSRKGIETVITLFNDAYKVLGKKELADLFSTNSDKYYKVTLFDKAGFERHKCISCGKFFWSLADRSCCPDHELYGFLGNPPTSKRLDYIDTWKEVEAFFRSNEHSIISRYPVVCRWRDDLYFTIASIVDFQRVIENKVFFELPSNPLLVPQMCIRFNDIENVGRSGRHYTTFCMLGQTCDADAPGGYWKDRCLDLDYQLLTRTLGIDPQAITFVEDVWMGAGAFGYSLEYFANGLELGNAVFTEFEGNENDYRPMKHRIIDMGAGLERFSWITMGTPTSYDCTFAPVIKEMINKTGTTADIEVLGNYFRFVSSKLERGDADLRALKSSFSKGLKMSFEELNRIVSPFEAIYTVAEHTRTLLFAISDGSIPSNVGGGYNLRVILRRALSILERLGWRFKLDEIADIHIGYLKRMYPELEEHVNDVRTILQIEYNRYSESKERMDAITSSIKTKKQSLSVDDLIRLYESDGITPELLVESGAIDTIPTAFYTKLAELHESHHSSSTLRPISGIEDLPPTRLLYYENGSITEFDSKVLAVAEDKYAILDQTAFYPRGGGQEPDTGEIAGIKVLDVIKQDQIVVHKVSSLRGLLPGMIVRGHVNPRRRDLITKHHTATHILNASARNTLGPWVWQNSAFKDEGYARLDITHHSSLTREEIEGIERTANKIVRRDTPVLINTFDRIDAERNYSFRIYQGGVVPSGTVRIVNIKDWDIEACGGTHVNRTGEIGLIKILKTERIQDGVVRLEFVAGEAAINHVEKQDNQLNTISRSLGASKEKIVESLRKSIDDADETKRKLKTIMRKTMPFVLKSISNDAKIISSDGTKLFSTYDEELDEDYYISIGEVATQKDPHLIFVALLGKGQGVRVVAFVGLDARKRVKASQIAHRLSEQLGGSGGGNEGFGQGGGRFKNKVREAISSLEEMISETIGQ
jgi:alanyl-tRNA synthetase